MDFTAVRRCSGSSRNGLEDSGLRSTREVTDIVPSYAQSNSVVLVGMGGAHDAAMRLCLLPAWSGRRLLVLDTTAPDAVSDVVSNLRDNNQFFVI